MGINFRGSFFVDLYVSSLHAFLDANPINWMEFYELLE